jgi:hypothetical protein
MNTVTTDFTGSKEKKKGRGREVAGAKRKSKREMSDKRNE